MSPYQVPYALLFPVMRATRPVHLFLFLYDYLSGEEYKP